MTGLPMYNINHNYVNLDHIIELITKIYLSTPYVLIS